MSEALAKMPAWRDILTAEAHGSPLWPVAEDARYYSQAISNWRIDHPGKKPCGLILGVTPLLYNLPWPDLDMVYGADRDLGVIEHVWPGPRDHVLASDWRDIPLPTSSVDIVMCDGGLHLLPFPTGQRQLASKLADIVRPGGRLVIRLFLPPLRSETVEDVLAQLAAGRVRNLGALKVRLGCALMPCSRVGVTQHAVWQCLRGFAGSFGWSGLAKRLRWREGHLAAIDSYRESLYTYHYVDEGVVIDTFVLQTGGAFRVERIFRPSYNVGFPCPILVVKKV